MRQYQSVADAFRRVEEATDKRQSGSGSYLDIKLALRDLCDELYCLGVPVADDDTTEEE